MNVLLLGGGGREHALARALAADPAVGALFIAPGNPGTSSLGTNIALDILDGPAVAEAARKLKADLVVVGPEAPLVAGVADAVRAAGIPVFGPSKEAARLEGSKAFAKEVMEAAGVATASARSCGSLAEAEAALDEFGAPYVVKDDGLAAGKGVVVTEDRAEALAHARGCLDKPGGLVLIEEYLDGPEVSLFCLSDGARVLPLEPAQDFKRIFDGQEGPNTGGMGAYSPLPWAPPDLKEQVVAEVAEPVIDEMARRGTPFVGLLYCGLALTSLGLRVVEFNVRFGDPETQSVLARLRTPLGQLLAAAASGELPEALEWSEDAAVTVVLSACGYPGPVRTGDAITGIEAAEAVPGAHVIQAGTSRDTDSGQLISCGGRVLATVGTGNTVGAARAVAYDAMRRIGLADSHFRTDIAAGI